MKQKTMKNKSSLAINDPLVSQLAKIDSLFEKYFVNNGENQIESLNFLLTKSGKKLRPLLLLLSAEIAGDCRDVSWIYATLVEVLHTASLVHDDIIDLAEMRRGTASVNRRFGNKIAVLVGDFLLSRSLSILAQKNHPEIIKIYAKASEQLCLGEILEQETKMQGKESPEKYFEIIGLKTASLFSASCEIGVLSADGSATLQKQMKEFGLYFGKAFQLRDDLLDFNGKQEDLGKEIGKDANENIMTYPLLSIFPTLDEKEKKQIGFWITRSHEKAHWEKLKNFIDEKQGFLKTEKKIEELSEKCENILTQLPKSRSLKTLRELLKINQNRKS